MSRILDKLILDYLENRIDGELFSNQFEDQYNFGSTVTSNDRSDKGYLEIFRASSLFTTIENEKSIYPGYIIDQELRKIVVKIARDKAIL